MKVIWDEKKNQENIKKHTISKENDETIRIISARKAEHTEKKQYGGSL